MCMYTCVCIYFRIYFCLYISLYVRNIYNIYISTYIITSFPSLLTCLSVCHYIRFILISGSHYFSITSYATSESPFPPQNLFNSIISHFPAFISSSCLFSFFFTPRQRTLSVRCVATCNYCDIRANFTHLLAACVKD